MYSDYLLTAERNTQPDFCAKMDTICRLCLQIEWHRSRSRQTGRVLGYPKKNFVDTGQARRKILFVQEGKGVQHPYKRHISGNSSGQSHTVVYSPATIPAAADFTLLQYILLPNKVKLRVNSESLPEKCSRCRHAQSSVYSSGTWQARPLC